MKPKILFTAVCLATFVLPDSMQAHDKQSSHGSHGAQGAHVHGIAQLLLTREGRQLELTLESPAVNLVGFEHPPGSEGEQEAIDQAFASLRDVGQLFVLSGGDCNLQDLKINNPFDGLAAKKPHRHGEEASGEHSEVHAEITVRYRFECDSNAEITGLRTGLLTVFPGIEQLEVQWINEEGQGAQRLRGNDDTVRLR